MPSGVKGSLNWGNSTVISTKDDYDPVEPIDYSSRAQFLINRGYVKDMTIDELVEKLKKDDK